MPNKTIMIGMKERTWDIMHVAINSQKQMNVP